MGSKAASKTQLNTMNATERERARDTADATDASDESIEACEKRSRADALHVAFVSGKEVVKEHVEWRWTRRIDGAQWVTAP